MGRQHTWKHTGFADPIAALDNPQAIGITIGDKDA